MQRSILEKRRLELENTFFAKLNQEKVLSYRNKMAHQQSISRLSEVTGIQNEALLEKILELGISTETLSALTLYPLVAIAWADGRVRKSEREAIARAARTSDISKSDEACELFEHWLEEKPSEQYMTTWGAYIQALSSELSATEKDQLKKEILSLSQKIANSAGGLFFDFLGGTSDEEKELLQQIEQAFN